MNALRTRFVEEITVDGNGAAAAVRAGYSEKSAKQQAYKLLQDEEIQRAIKERYVSLAMSAEEATKRMSDIAATRLNDYITVEEVWETPMVKKHLLELIAELQHENDIDDEYADRVELTEAEQDDLFIEKTKRKRQIIRYEIELEMNPNAYRVVKGEPRLVKKPSVDLIKLAKADERGAIRKLSFNERGLPSVECYAADKALEIVLKLNGKLIDRVDHTNNGKSFGDFLMEDDE